MLILLYIPQIVTPIGSHFILCLASDFFGARKQFILVQVGRSFVNLKERKKLYCMQVQRYMQ